MTFEEFTALINRNPRATYYGMVNDRMITLTGSVMKGFVLPTDDIDWMKEWK